jgi:hypothetical protein
MAPRPVPPGPTTISAKLTPEVMAVDFGTDYTGCGAGGGKIVADVKKAPPANWVADAKVDFYPPVPIIPTGPGLHPPNPRLSRGPTPQTLIGLRPTAAV